MILFYMPLLIKSISPERTYINICLVIILVIHLNPCEHSLPCLVSNLDVFILKFVLQHYAKCWWCSNLWELLYLIYFNSWAWQEKIIYFYFQQFLHCETPGFMLVPQIVAMWFPMLKHLFNKLLNPLCIIITKP